MNLRAGSQLVEELEQFMVQENIQSLDEIRGII